MRQEQGEPSQWQKARMTRQERMLRARLEPASAERVKRYPADARWFCLVVVEGGELSVGRRLEGGGVEVLVPTEKLERRNRKGKLYEVERASFTGYVFVRIVPSVSAFERLRGVKGVVDFLRAGEFYHTIRDQDLGFYVSKVHAERMPKDATIGDGSRVRIKFGPFAGLDAVVLQVTAPKSRDPHCRVWSETYQREIRNIPLAFLERL
ncbi:transcription termination/antitermination NusG family protein [Rhizobium sp. CSW-27]|uniref:transcription termination/antitermination protein NusG n=1 Tax=Rhizobium sp. CSW-27 TaxID=2839985 RepID=UPI001C00BF9D|nr:transcription termination/antitermination NusG family protein [Rhizobium sp. CSW-27]MBT9373195.1 hypothetical protein [Rhizobium sp. CSW-27]